MCGIAGVHRLSDRPFPELDAFCGRLLRGIEPRGRDATGYVAVDGAGGVQLQKASCSAFYFNANRARITDQARTVLLHTRWATQGKPAFPENNHPVVSGGIYCVHNGHIYNDVEVFEDTGKHRAGAVDSESIPALVASKGWETLPHCLEGLDGDFAVALVDPRRAGELVLAKGSGSPLVYVKTDHLLVWASTYEAIMGAWKDTIGTPPGVRRSTWLRDGEAVMVDGSTLETRRFEVPAPKLTFSWASQNYCSTDTKAASEDTKKWSSSLKVTASEVSNMLALTPAEEQEEQEEMEAGLDFVQCEDCSDWVEAGDLRIVHSYGFQSALCHTCAEWAEKYVAIQ